MADKGVILNVMNETGFDSLLPATRSDLVVHGDSNLRIIVDQLTMDASYKLIAPVLPTTTPNNSVFLNGVTWFTAYNLATYSKEWVESLGLTYSSGGNCVLVRTTKDPAYVSRMSQEVLVFLGSTIVGKFARASAGTNSWGVWKRLTFDIVNDSVTGGTDKAASAETVKKLQSEVDKKVEINKFHSSRIMTNLSPQSFTKAMYVDFANNTTSEAAEIEIPTSIAFSGSIELNLTSSFFNSDATGTAKIMIHITMSPTGVISTQIVDIITMTPQFAQNFYVGKVTWVADSNTYVLVIYKRQYKNPLQIEMTFRCSGGNFYQSSMDALKVSTWSIADVISTTDFPIQQSIFTHVGNSKVLLAASITGKGVTTSADATFAQMAANIDAIPSGKKYYETTLSGNVAQKKFYSVSGSLINSDFNFITVTIPFNPSLIHVRSIKVGDYLSESYYTSFSDGYTTGTVKLAQYNGLQANGSSFNMKPFATNLGNGSWSYEIPVMSYNTTYTVRAYG